MYSYGIIDGKPEMDPDLMKVSDMIEKPSVAKAPSRFAALGRYVISPDIFFHFGRIKTWEGWRDPADGCASRTGAKWEGLCI